MISPSTHEIILLKNDLFTLINLRPSPSRLMTFNWNLSFRKRIDHHGERCASNDLKYALYVTDFSFFFLPILCYDKVLTSRDKSH